MIAAQIGLRCLKFAFQIRQIGLKARGKAPSIALLQRQEGCFSIVYDLLLYSYTEENGYLVEVKL